MSFLHRLFRGGAPASGRRPRRRGRRLLREAFERLEAELPRALARRVRPLRHPRLATIRIPLAILLVVGSVFSFLPFLGLWMLPAGLLLLALDVPALRPWVARTVIRLIGLWTRMRERWSSRRH